MVLSKKLWLLLAVMALQFGCISGAQPLKLKQPAAISTVYVMQFPDRPDVLMVPDSVADRTEAELAKRNLQSKRIAFDTYAGEFRKKRATDARLLAVAPSTKGTPYTALVETQVRFYTYLNGRFRWNVVGRVTFVHNENPASAKTTDFEMSAFLQFDHQNEADALEYVEVALAERVGQASDAFLAGLDNTPVDVQVKADPKPRSSEKFAWDDSVYFIMVDRFANGDPSNDGEVDTSDPQAFHGGDIRGIINNLDHLQNLGVRTIWLSPIFKMRTAKFHGHGAFHGYWVEDLAVMEPRFGTEDDLKELAAELQKRDMRVILDMVLNHVAPESPQVAQKPNWFHGNGGITDWNDPVQLTTYDVHGLPDLNQNNPEVYQHLIKSSEHWIDVLKPAGFRLDAVKHMPNDFWAKYNAHIREYAGPEFVMLGEDLNGNPADVAATATAGQFNAIFDFPLHFAMIDVFCKDQNVGRLASVLSADSMYPAEVQDRGLVTLLDNHDLPRVMAACGNDRIRVRDALTFMTSVRGTPSFTWGTETGMAGAKEPDNRETMDFKADPIFGPAIRDALQRRSKNLALTQGKSWIAQMDEDLMVLVRLHEKQTALVMVNRGMALKKVTVPAALGLGDIVLEAPAGSVSLEFLDPSPNYAAVIKSLENPETVEVEFRTDNLQTEEGDRVFVVGSDPRLGNWKVDGAPAMTAAEGVWTVKVPLKKSAAFAYKFVRKKADGTVVWEDGPNRYVFAQ